MFLGVYYQWSNKRRADEGLRSSAGLLSHMIGTKTKDSYLATDAPFCSTVAQNGETFFEHIGHPENSGAALKVIKGVVPWLNVSALRYTCH